MTILGNGYSKPQYKYSVLMAVYINDSPEYLRIALRSIYDDQTKKPDEVVVVFDGPLNANQLEVLEEFRKGRENVVRFFPLEMNCGLGEALRIGSEKCIGDYIFRMDSDDVSASNRFEKQISYIEDHPEIDVLGTNISEFVISPDDNNKRIRTVPTKHEDIVKMARIRNPMNHMSVCIKKTALDKCGGYQSLLLLEDYYLWLRMITSGCRLANLHETLVYVRINGFESRRGSKERIEGWRVLQDYMYEHGMITKLGARMNMIYIWGFVKAPPWIKRVLYNILFRA